MSWTAPPERVPEPPPQPQAATTWRPRGPAVARTLAAAVLGPCVLVLVALVAQPRLEEESLSDVSFAGYCIGGAGALAVLAVLLWALVAQARTRPAPPGAPQPGNATLIAAVVLLGLSVLYLLVVPLAIVAFLGAAVLILPAALVAVPAAIGALLGLINARGGHCGPTQLTATCAAVAGWVVAVIGMPVAGGLFVLSVAGF